MTRYARLYAYFLRFSFSRAMEFRLDFFFRIFMDALWYGVNLAFFWVLYRHSGLLGGWNFDQTLIFAAGVFVADGFHMTVFANNMWMFPILVNKGDLDYYLVRPVSSLFFISLRDFAANSFLNLLMALGVLAWALIRYPEPVGLDRIAIYLALMGVGFFINYTIHLLFLVPVFWMHSGEGLRDIFFTLGSYSNRPDGIYRGWIRRFLTTILPFAIMVSFPTRVLFGGNVGEILLHMGIVAAVAFGVLLLFWRLGLRAYGSASS